MKRFKNQMIVRQKKLRRQVIWPPLTGILLMAVLYIVYLLSFQLGFPIGPNSLGLKILILVIVIVVYSVFAYFLTNHLLKIKGKQFRLEFGAGLAEIFFQKDAVFSLGESISEAKRTTMFQYTELKQFEIGSMVTIIYLDAEFEIIQARAGEVYLLIIQYNLNYISPYFIQFRTDKRTDSEKIKYNGQQIKRVPSEFSNLNKDIALYSTLTEEETINTLATENEVAGLLDLGEKFKASGYVCSVAGPFIQFVNLNTRLALSLGLNEEINDKFFKAATEHYEIIQQLLPKLYQLVANVENLKIKGEHDESK